MNAFAGSPRVLRALPFLFAIGLFAVAGSAFAQAAPTAAAAALPAVNVGSIGNQPVSMPLQVLLLMTGITLLPAALLGITAFTRITIVLGLLRQALGTGQTPSNQVLLALSLFLTAMVMMPVFDQAWSAGIAPYLNHTMDFKSAWAGASAPFRGFMWCANARPNCSATTKSSSCWPASASRWRSTPTSTPA